MCVNVFVCVRAVRWKFHKNMLDTYKLARVGGTCSRVKAVEGEFMRLIWEEIGGQIWSKWNICKTFKQLIQQRI